VVAELVRAGGGDERDETVQKLVRLEHDVGRAVAPAMAQAVMQAPVGEALQPLGGDGRPRGIAALCGAPHKRHKRSKPSTSHDATRMTRCTEKPACLQARSPAEASFSSRPRSRSMVMTRRRNSSSATPAGGSGSGVNPLSRLKASALTSACRCGCQLARSPSVWIDTTIPGTAWRSVVSVGGLGGDPGGADPGARATGVPPPAGVRSPAFLVSL